MVDVCVVLAGRFMTLPNASCSQPHMIAYLQCIVVRRVVRFSYALKLCCISVCDVRALPHGIAIRLD